MTYESKNDHGALHVTNKIVTIKVSLDSYRTGRAVREIGL